MNLFDLARELLPAIVSGIACGLVTFGTIRADLRHARREVARAHKRLDLMRAPNVTLDES